VKVALEAIDTIYRERGNNIGDTGSCAAWWYNVLYLYTSATVLIAARLSSPILADVSEESILQGWKRALEVLDEYSHFGASIRQLPATLRLLFEAVPQHYSRLKGNARSGQGDTITMPGTRDQSMATLPYSTESASDFAGDPLGGNLQDDNTFPNDAFADFDIIFDPNDISWLMTVPMDI
jgi:hypothetical protein